MIRATEGESSRRRAVVEKVATRAGKRSARLAKRLDGIADAMRNAVAVSITRGLRKFKTRVSHDQIADLYERGKFDDIVTAIPWGQLGDDLAPMARRHEVAALRGAEFAVDTLPAPPKELQPSIDNPRVQRFVETRVAAVLGDLERVSQQSVSRAIADAVRQNLTPKEAAKYVREAAGGGITPSQSAALELSRERDLVRRVELQGRLKLLTQDRKGGTARALQIKAQLQTLTDSRIQERFMQKYDAMQANRAKAIARTEITAAMNAGQEAVWAEAADRGLIDRRQARKVWVTVPDMDRSDICTELDGQAVGLDELFHSSITGESFSSPPAHPNCRSAVVIEFT